MRKRRIKVIHGDGFYHCMTRTVNGDRLLKSQDKEVLRRMIRQVADFSGVDVLTYCVMDNHFHVLIRIAHNAKEVSDSEIVRRYRCLYPSGGKYQQMTPDILKHLLQNNDHQALTVKEGIVKRMGDVSEFMKTLKQRFSVYYNQNHGRYGTLWAERFKSVLVEPENKAILAIAAYIDLNPVRAGITEDPKEYRYCGYAEALAGNRKAKKGLSVALVGHVTKVRRSTLAHYRMVLFGIGSHQQKEGRREISKKYALRVLEKEKGRVPLFVLLRCRLRYFTDGLVLGSESYLKAHLGDPLRRIKKIPMSNAGWAEISVGKGFRGPTIL